MVVIGTSLLLILVLVYWKNSQSLVELQPEGKAFFYRGGFFSQDKFTLTKDGNKWRFSRAEPFETGELILPFECYYNASKTLRLENDGRVYLSDRNDRDRTELRVVDGEWSYDADDHWQSIFDLGELDAPEPP
jgi:hypothetical protein